MQKLNYHHLLYFWAVAKYGSIAKAGKELRVAHPTISGQIHRLEQVLGEKLFQRRGRNLTLTDFGGMAFRYADQIFSLGQEFMHTVQDGLPGRPLRLAVGISHVLPQIMVQRLLAPAFGLKEPVHVICRDDRSFDALMGDLASNSVDVVLSDSPAHAGSPVRAFSHLLGECGTAFFAAPQLAKICRHRFPRSLHGCPFLIPGSNCMLRRILEEWFSVRNIHPQIVAEVDDAALAKIFCEQGLGVLAAPDVLAADVQQHYRVQMIGRAREIRQRFYAISSERKIMHPALIAISETARKNTFALGRRQRLNKRRSLHHPAPLRFKRQLEPERQSLRLQSQ